jgi:hypothetical protein
VPQHSGACPEYTKHSQMGPTSVKEKGKPTAPNSRLNSPGESSSQALGALPPTIQHRVKPNPQYIPATIDSSATLVQWNLAFSSPAARR